jgi:hypothetical protein
MITLLYVVAGLVGLLALALVVARFLPSRWRAERQIVIRADAARVYPYVASLRTGWPKWSPFGVAKDPNMTLAYFGPDEGLGAGQSWKSRKLGDGQMTIVEAEAPAKLGYQLETGGFALNGLIRLGAVDGGTLVSWRDQGDLGGMYRWFGLVANHFVGKHLEEGLRTLKQVAESSATP